MASAYAAALEQLRRERGKAASGAPASPAALQSPRGAAGAGARLPLQSPLPKQKRKREAAEAEAPQPRPQHAAASPGATQQPRPAAAAAASPAAAGGAKARVKQQKRHSGIAVDRPQQQQPAHGGAARPHSAPKPLAASDTAAAAPASGAPAALTKRQKLMASVHLPSRAPVTPAAKSALSFDSDWHDHCETPFEAYRDVEPLLFQLAQRAGRTKATLRIYDPYFCEGSMVRHLGRLGFEAVYNRDEDCYAAWAAGATPEFDVLVTNPPYSCDHIRRCVDFAARCGRPWMLLLPSFVCRKRSYGEILEQAGAPPPAYLVPARRYVYYAPGRSAERTAPTSPFDSMWYLSLGGQGDATSADALLAWWERKYAKASGCTLARAVAALPPELTPVRDEKRANPKARRRAAKRAGILHQKFGIAHAHIRDKKRG